MICLLRHNFYFIFQYLYLINFTSYILCFFAMEVIIAMIFIIYKCTLVIPMPLLPATAY